MTSLKGRQLSLLTCWFLHFQIDLYVDGQLVVTNKENFQVIKDHALKVIDGTEDTIFAVGACWHGKQD